MTNCIITQTKQWFEEAVPTPTKNTQKVQVGVHIEEFLEMMQCIDVPTNPEQLEAIKTAAKILSDTLKEDPSANLVINNRKEFLDAICDQQVTATGCGHVFGMDTAGALNEVNRSNWSKFENNKAIFKSNGKIAKGVNYSEPNLDSFLGIDPT
jgi:hypothetical protein